MKHLQIGQKARMTNNALENYGEEYRGKVFTVCHVARNRAEHPGYDEGVSPDRLYDFNELEFSLYDYEIVPT